MSKAPSPHPGANPTASRQVRSVMARGIVNLPALAARGVILAYRYTLSSLAGRTCRHLPTCSEYADTAIARFGLWRGGWMGLARFWRCRPGGSHGFDPVPETLPVDSRWYRPWRYGFWGSDLPG